jgi:hypothetical protein
MTGTWPNGFIARNSGVFCSLAFISTRMCSKGIYFSSRTRATIPPPAPGKDAEKSLSTILEFTSKSREDRVVRACPLTCSMDLYWLPDVLGGDLKAVCYLPKIGTPPRPTSIEVVHCESMHAAGEVIRMK